MIPSPPAAPHRKRILIALHWGGEALLAGALRHCVETDREPVVVTADNIGELRHGDYAGALCALPAEEHPVHRFVKEAGVPVVELSISYPENGDWCRYPSDSGAAGRLAADYLRRRPVVAFAYVSHMRNATDAAREKAFRDALARAGDRRPVSSHVYRDLPAERDLPSAVSEIRLAGFLESLPKPVAVFGSVDSIARIVTDFARESGLRVPEDVCVLGYGDNALVSLIAPVPVSSLAIDYGAWARAAMALLEDRISGRVPPGTTRTFMPGGIVERASTGGASRGDPLCDKALALMRANLRQPFRIGGLAAKLGVSPTTLKRAFAETLQTGVAERQLDLRIECAKGLLASGDKVDAVAAAVGFGSARSLRKAFIKKTGVTPGGFSPPAGSGAELS